jgi:hypothetical protein
MNEEESQRFLLMCNHVGQAIRRSSHYCTTTNFMQGTL